ncbi:hypothetical protein B0H12DRAFT_1127676, partial [Mycena haematopus]
KKSPENSQNTARLASERMLTLIHALIPREPRSQRNPENPRETKGFERDPEVDKEMETQIIAANQKEPEKTTKKLEGGRRGESSQET